MVYTTHLFRHTRLVIGQNIHNSRVKRKLSLKKLSRLTGLPEGVLDQYELGKGAILLEHILSALGIAAPELMQEP